MVAIERQAIANRPWEPTDADDLRTAIAHRTTTIYAHAVTEQPQWVVDLLTELDDRGTLQQLRPNQIRQLIADSALERETGPEPTARSIPPTAPEASLAR